MRVRDRVLDCKRYGIDSPLGLRGDDQLPSAGTLLDVGIETLRILAVVPPLGLRLGLSGRSTQTRGSGLWRGDDTLDISRRRAWHNHRIPVGVGWVVRRGIVGRPIKWCCAKLGALAVRPSLASAAIMTRTPRQGS